MYIRNWSLQPFSQDLRSCYHITYFVCVNFYIWAAWIFLRNFSWQFYISSGSFAMHLLRGILRRNIFHISFSWSLTWGLNRDLISNKSTHYLLDHGDFNVAEYYLLFCLYPMYFQLILATFWILLLICYSYSFHFYRSWSFYVLELWLKLVCPCKLWDLQQ